MARALALSIAALSPPALCLAFPFSTRGSVMMWYAIWANDVVNSLERRKAARPDHVARLRALQAEERLLLAGPFPAVDSEDPGQAGYTGSLIIARFETLEAARAWADADPYKAAGVYANVEIRPFRQTLP